MKSLPSERNSFQPVKWQGWHWIPASYSFHLFFSRPAFWFREDFFKFASQPSDFPSECIWGAIQWCKHSTLLQARVEFPPTHANTLGNWHPCDFETIVLHTLVALNLNPLCICSNLQGTDRRFYKLKTKIKSKNNPFVPCNDISILYSFFPPSFAQPPSWCSAARCGHRRVYARASHPSSNTWADRCQCIVFFLVLHIPTIFFSFPGSRL